MQVDDEDTIQVKTNSDHIITYESSDSSVATVDKEGNLRDKNDGNTTITIRVDGKKKTCNVYVQAKPKAVPKESTPSRKQEANDDQGSSENISYTVYITKTGSKYHRDGCRYLSRNQVAIDKAAAMNQGYSACSVCHP